MTLLEECIECLGTKCSIIEGIDKEKIINRLYTKVKFTEWGRIDWEKFNNYIAYQINDLKTVSGKYFILWDESTLPIILTEIYNIMDNIYDVLAVSFDTWLIAEDMSIIIEIFHDGYIRKLVLK